MNYILPHYKSILMKYILVGISMLFIVAPLLSQTPTGSGSDELKKDEESQMILETLDSLTNLLYQANAFSLDTSQPAKFKKDEIPVYSDSVYKYRLSVLASPIEMTYNETVRKYIDMYLVYKRGQVQKMVGLSGLYFPLFEEIMDRHDLPLEFKYLPIIESALNPHAVSRVGATGLWQFMYPTGKMYGLSINSYVDERRDPYLATDAAARYLKDLFNLYGNWSLALAAYNCGPGNVNKAIRRSGGKTTYWEIRDYLPRETRGYVPAFIAAVYMMNYYSEHNITPMIPDIDLSSMDTVLVRQEVKTADIAKYTGMTEDELLFINPALKRKKIPYYPNGYVLNLPLGKIADYDMNRDSIFMAASNTPSQPSNSTPEFTSAKTYAKSVKTKSKSSKKSNYDYYVDTKNNTKLIYTVKSGDNLGFISEWYDCRTRDLQNWNNIYGSRIYAGQKLKVYVPNGKVTKFKNIDNLSFQQKQQIEAKKNNKTDISASSGQQNTGQVLDPNKKYIHYTIKSGDTLWDLTKKYPKNTVEELKKINNITDMKVIKPGYVLKVAI